MPVIPFSTQSYNRVGYGVPQARVQNMFIEETPAGPGQAARIARPGLTLSFEVGVGPIRCLYQGSGVVGSYIYTVSGASLYKGATPIGNVGNDGAPAWIAGSGDQLGIVSAGALYCYDGTSLTHIQYFKDSTDPLPAFSGIEYISGRFYLIVRNSDQYDWADLSDLTQIDPLSFATAEAKPDITNAIKRLGDEIWFFGAESVEPSYQTGDADAPLQRSQGRIFEKGCPAASTVLPLDNTLFFLGSDSVVYRASTVPQRISTHGVEFYLSKCSDVSLCTAFPVSTSGHLFYVLNIYGQGTFSYDVANDQWSEWTSYGLTTFIGSCGQVIDGVSYVGSAVDGKVYTQDQAVNTDNGQPITCLATASLPNTGGQITNFSLMLQCNRGLGNASGTYQNPLVEMRYSDDAGRIWSTWKRASLGKQGEYSFKAIWRRLGAFGSPGRLYEFRVTDPVPIVFEYVSYNQGTP